MYYLHKIIYLDQPFKKVEAIQYLRVLTYDDDNTF